MTALSELAGWARDVFGSCSLGDPRRVARLVDYAARQAANPKGSTSEVCRDSPAAAEGAYRMLRNDEVVPEELALGMFKHVATLATECECVLAIEDTTSVSVHSSELRQQLQEEGCPTGYLVHNVLLVDFNHSEILGLIDQTRWIRSPSRASKESRKTRPYEEKESVRWEQSLTRTQERLEHPERVVTVCDREADIWEMLQYCVTKGHRFVIRAAQNRRTSEQKLWDEMESSPVRFTREITIAQRGAQKTRGTQRARSARPARTATTEIRARSITLTRGQQELRLHAVFAREIGIGAAQDTDPTLEWMLLTTEPIETAEQIERVLQMYEYRWLIEEFHKTWKSGCRLEERALQSLGAVERMMVLLAAVAVRMLRLRTMAEGERAQEPCDGALEPDEWECLWACTSKKPIPREAPDCAWALRSIAKLGGFLDTKRTGRPGWETLWKGYHTLQERLIGWRLARRFSAHL